jgi:uncharacterized membrane protein YwaF
MSSLQVALMWFLAANFLYHLVKFLAYLTTPENFKDPFNNLEFKICMLTHLLAFLITVYLGIEVFNHKIEKRIELESPVGQSEWSDKNTTKELKNE